MDPAFAALRLHPRYQSWLARIKNDNARQLKQLKARDAARPAG
jgi:glycine cleavage system H lipoate-binding protein